MSPPARKALTDLAGAVRTLQTLLPQALAELTDSPLRSPQTDGGGGTPNGGHSDPTPNARPRKSPEIARIEKLLSTAAELTLEALTTAQTAVTPRKVGPCWICAKGTTQTVLSITGACRDCSTAESKASSKARARGITLDRQAWRTQRRNQRKANA